MNIPLTIGLHEAIGGVVFICGIVWWLGRKFGNIEVRLDNIERKIDEKS